MFGEMSIRIQEGKQRARYSNGYKAKHVSRHFIDPIFIYTQL